MSVPVMIIIRGTLLLESLLEFFFSHTCHMTFKELEHLKLHKTLSSIDVDSNPVIIIYLILSVNRLLSWFGIISTGLARLVKSF